MGVKEMVLLRYIVPVEIAVEIVCLMLLRVTGAAPPKRDGASCVRYSWAKPGGVCPVLPIRPVWGCSRSLSSRRGSITGAAAPHHHATATAADPRIHLTCKGTRPTPPTHHQLLRLVLR